MDSSVTKIKYVGTIILGLGLLIWILLIYIGMGIITKKLINYNNSISLNQNEQNITKMSIIMFWLTFVPISIISLFLFVYIKINKKNF